MHSNIERMKKRRAVSIFVPVQWATLIASRYDTTTLYHKDFIDLKSLAVAMGTKTTRIRYLR